MRPRGRDMREEKRHTESEIQKYRQKETGQAQV